MEDIWLQFAKRLHALSTTGIAFTKEEYDRERYEEIQQIASQMMSLLADVPIERIHDLVTKHSKGYVTPKIDVRGAVFRDGRILLVQEKSDGLWTLPGGFADVGLTAAENVTKEIEEEAGIRTSAQRLYSLRHKSAGSYAPDVREFYKLFFICEPLNDADPSPGIETEQAQFFHQTEIPPLSTGRVIESDLHMAWRYRSQSSAAATFD